MHYSISLQAKERSQLEAQLADAEQRLEVVQKERAEQEEHLSAATDRVEGVPVCGGALTWLRNLEARRLAGLMRNGCPALHLENWNGCAQSL